MILNELISVPDRITGVFTGSGVTANFWLYWGTTLIDLMLALLSAVLFYNTTKSIILTRKSIKGGFSQPVNIYKLILLCVSSLVFLRVSIDAIILLTWKEISNEQMNFWQLVNQVFDTLAAIPFFVFFYCIIRAGPVLEFQLLRQPIPTDLLPSWKMIRQPVIALVLVVLLSFTVVSTKLLP